eukprot:CAMPEP_0114555430 /NCGR_PEP_ID=MMETSP0114-20121206/8745_1 /TAXON_ID=31324 /ORGANISM="Goniomonas sp, Strain m" /LENGTH=504 /DNA_ID=CAMNT_0001740555 /DNA_START=33 /DNA_END=1547 /DNA_ORIENTATION=-
MSRIVVDKRTSRKEHAADFKASIDEFRANLPPAQPRDASIGLGNIQICTRKRPVFDHELEAGEYDNVTCNGDKNIIVHDGRMAADLKSKFLVSYSMPFDHVFDEKATNEDVFEATLRPQVDYSMAGGLSTIFMFGQTGSGKTHTMSGLQRLGAAHIFEQLAAAQEREGEELAVSFSFFELAGSDLFDLLNNRAPGSLAEDKKGTVFVRGMVEHPVSSTAELLAAWEAGAALRATESTGANSESSRSHAVSRVFIRKGGKAFGLLNMVDLAGSERKEDSMFHNKDRRREGAAINTSLMALKECIRLLVQQGNGASVHIPFRSNQLTQLLKSAFTKPNARTVAIATVAPTPTDTEHTVNTLKHACMMKGLERKIVETKVPVVSQNAVKVNRPVLPAKWSADEVRTWMSKVCDGRFATAARQLTSGMNGAQLTRLGLPRYVQLCGGDEALGAALMAEVKKETQSAKDGMRAGAPAPEFNNYKAAGLRPSTAADKLDEKENVVDENCA